MSTVDSSPSRPKFCLSQASVRSRSTFIRWFRLSQSALSLLRAPSSAMTSAASVPWISIRFIGLSRILPSSISLVTKAIVRISRISEELKLISLMRFMISLAVVGSVARSSGLM